MSYLFAVTIGVDVLANAVLGGQPYQTLSCRIGLNIEAGGWASRIPWPQWLRDHFKISVFTAVV